MEGLFTNKVSTLAAKEGASQTNKRAINRSFFFFNVYINLISQIILRRLPKAEIQKQAYQKSYDTVIMYIHSTCFPEAQQPA